MIKILKAMESPITRMTIMENVPSFFLREIVSHRFFMYLNILSPPYPLNHGNVMCTVIVLQGVQMAEWMLKHTPVCFPCPSYCLPGYYTINTERAQSLRACALLVFYGFSALLSVIFCLWGPCFGCPQPFLACL